MSHPILDKMRDEAAKRCMEIEDVTIQGDQSRFKIKTGVFKDIPDDFLDFYKFISDNQIASDIGCVFNWKEGIYALETFILDTDNILAIKTLEQYGRIKARTPVSFLNMFRILLDNLNTRKVQLPN